ncbi:MAG: hypothetical protein NXI31_18535 [bacterium]|nr:hypothetical protein [bacterium]
MPHRTTAILPMTWLPMTWLSGLRRLRLPSLLLASLSAAAATGLEPALIGQQAPGQATAAGGAPKKGILAAKNPYRLEPFHPDFPVQLSWPRHSGLEFDQTRRQLVRRVVANLEGAGTRESWQFATEFFWRGDEELVEPLIAAMDRAYGDPSRSDMVRNCVEAMGRMSDPAFDDALLRALEHRNDKIRQAAFGALANSSTDATLRALFPSWPAMNARARSAWLTAARKRLGAEAVPMFRQLMQADYAASVRDQVLVEAVQMPPKQAAAIMRGRWNEALGEFKAIIAGVLHAAGDTAGTTWLRDVLTGEDLEKLPLAVRHCRYGELGVLQNELLALSAHPRADVRRELATLLMRFEGDDIADVYELLSQPEEAWEIKSIALRELHRRGRSAAATALLEEVATAKGSRLQRVLDMLGATADPRAVPIFKKRFESAPAGEGRPFLQSLAVLGGETAARAMLDLFRADEKLVDRAGATGKLTTINYIPLLLMNVRGMEDLLIEAFEQLPKEDWRRRAALMPTILGMAADRNDPAVLARCVVPLRRVLFDREQLPQLRVLALNLLARRSLTIDDIMKLQNRRFDEQRGMKVLFNDFLMMNF